MSDCRKGGEAMSSGMVIDCFADGGGASQGIEESAAKIAFDERHGRILMVNDIDRLERKGWRFAFEIAHCPWCGERLGDAR